MFKYSNVQMFKCSDAQMFKCSNVQMFEWSKECQISIRLNFCRSVPLEFLHSFFILFAHCRTKNLLIFHLISIKAPQCTEPRYLCYGHFCKGSDFSNNQPVLPLFPTTHLFQYTAQITLLCSHIFVMFWNWYNFLNLTFWEKPGFCLMFIFSDIFAVK